MPRKIYRIKFQTLNTVGRFLYELNQWGVLQTRYSVNGMTVTTKDPNVVDVATESFDPTELEITTERT